MGVSVLDLSARKALRLYEVSGLSRRRFSLGFFMSVLLFGWRGHGRMGMRDGGIFHLTPGHRNFPRL